MRAQANGIHFLGALVIDVGADQLLGEDIAIKEEGMVFFKGSQRVF